MREHDLDEIVQKWVDDETASAPTMRPTAEMYRRVRGLARRHMLGRFVVRHRGWATVLAAVVVLALGVAILQWPHLLAPGWGGRASLVPQRVAFVQGKGRSRSGPPEKGKGPRDGLAPIAQLVFQIRQADVSVDRSMDLLTTEPTLVLTAKDSYRLVIELAEARHIYAYQQGPRGSLALLYPNPVYGQGGNPVPTGTVVYLPAQPSGFYIEGEEGRYRLYIVVSEAPIAELETLWDGYSGRGLSVGRRRSLARLRELLDGLVRGERAGVSGRRFEFEAR